VHQPDEPLKRRIGRLRRAADAGDRRVGCRLGDTEVDGPDDREGDAGDHLQRRVDDAVGPVGKHALVGDEDVRDAHVVARRAAHPERVPVLFDDDAVRHRDCHVEHAQALHDAVPGAIR